MKMNAIGIVSADIKRSLEFYSLLGVAVPSYDASEDHVQCELSPGLTLMWDTVGLIMQITPGYVPQSGGPIGLCFECESPARVDEVYAKVIAAGFGSEKEPWDAFWGQRYAIVGDPDGNAISVYAPLAS